MKKNNLAKLLQTYSFILVIMSTHERVPSTPILTLGDPQPTSIELLWTQQDNDVVNTYTISYRRNAFCAGAPSGNRTVNGNIRSYNLIGLEENIGYEVSIEAFGFDSSSITTAIFTTRATLPSCCVPTPQVIANNETSVNVTWEREHCLVRNGQPREYILRYGLLNSNTSTTMTGINPYSPGSHVFNSLRGNTWYIFEVALVNEVGQGPYSLSIKYTGPASASNSPSAPTPSLIQVQSTSLTVTWTTPPMAEKVDYYLVSYYEISGCGNTSHTRRISLLGTQTSCTLTELEENTIYAIILTAANTVGFSTSPAITATTASAVPSCCVPTPQVMVNSARSVTVTWEREHCLVRNGQPREYILRYGLLDSNTSTIITKIYSYLPGSHVFNSLRGNTWYIFEVALVNEVGQGPYSTSIKYTGPASASHSPSAPILSLIQVQSRFLTVTWTAPPMAEEVDYYLVSYYKFGNDRRNSQGRVSLLGPQTSCTLTMLEENTTYAITLTAGNTVGFSTSQIFTATSTSVVIIAHNLSGYHHGSSATVTCSSVYQVKSILWRNASSNVILARTTEDKLRLVIHNISSHLHKTVYTCEVSFIIPSGVVAISKDNFTLITTPGEVEIINISSPDDHSLVVMWATPSLFTDEVLSYDVSVIPTHVNTYQSRAGNIAVQNNTLTATRLSEGVPYNVSISAINSVGKGETKSLVLFTKEQTPVAPQNISATWSSPSVIRVRWTLLSLYESRGTVILYTITYTSITTGMAQKQHLYTFKEGGNIAEVDQKGLNEETSYIVQMWASTRAGPGQPSPVIVVSALNTKISTVTVSLVIAGCSATLAVVLTISIAIWLTLRLQKCKRGKKKLKEVELKSLSKNTEDISDDKEEKPTLPPKKAACQESNAKGEVKNDNNKTDYAGYYPLKPTASKISYYETVKLE